MTVTTLVLLPKWSTLSSMMSECVHRRWGVAGGGALQEATRMYSVCVCIGVFVCVCVLVCVGVLTGPSSCRCAPPSPFHPGSVAMVMRR